MSEPIEGTAVEESEAEYAHATDVEMPATRREIVPAPTASVAPQATADDLVARLDAIKAAQTRAMEKGVDYGVIPGTDKPTLYKPGAEKLAALFQLDVQPQNEMRWDGDHLTVISRVTIYHAPTGARLGGGEGICSTRERKYAYRKQERTCPSCGAAAVIKGKKEYGGGWLCWKKRNGCGSKWPDGAEEIESQEVGEVDNPDLPDLWNTADKMATKRALVAAVLIVTGASAVFTQDVEDAPDAPPPEPDPAPPANGGNGNGGEGGAPQTTAQQRKDSVKPITGEQKGKINARCAAAGLTAGQANAIRSMYAAKAKVAHYDRLPSTEASKLIRALGEDGSGADKILTRIYESAKGGDDYAQAIVQRLEAEASEIGGRG